MNLGALILLGLIAGGIFTIVKLNKQGKRIDKLEESGKKKKQS